MKKLKTIIEFETESFSSLENPKGLTFSFDNLEEIKTEDILNYQNLTEKDAFNFRSLKSKATPGRYGSIISLPEPIAWFLDLLERVFSKKFSHLNHDPRRVNRKGSLNGLLVFILESLITEPLSKLNMENDPKFQESIFTRNIFDECKKELNKVVMLKSKTDSTVFQIPVHAYTFHMIPLFRYLLLEILSPDLLKDKEKDILYFFFGPKTLKKGQFHFFEESKIDETAKSLLPEFYEDFEIDFDALKKEAKKEVSTFSKNKSYRGALSQYDIGKDILLNAKMIVLVQFNKDFEYLSERIRLLKDFSKKIGKISNN